MARKLLRTAIAVFVVAFAAFVAVSLVRGGRGRATRDNGTTAIGDPKALIQAGAGTDTRQEKGKDKIHIDFGNVRTYDNNTSKFGGGVTMVLPDRGGRRITIKSQDAEVTTPPGKQVGHALFTGGVRMTTSDGITITSPTATYDDADGMTRIPGPIHFTKGRMTGSGVGGTYDENRGILWILDQAKVDAAPDPDGHGAIHVTATAAGFARQEHFMKFTGGARLDGEGHVTSADEATAYLTPDDQHVQRMELRGKSSILSQPGGGGPQDMAARDIDLGYAADGRTLQNAHLVENASVQLPGETGKAGRRVAAKTMDIALAPDGATVTNLVGNEAVVVDLPAEAELPARRITSTALVATGPANAGIQAATFTGDVVYREHRAARGKLAAIARTATSTRLDVKTKPGFGDIEKAEFHNHVRFADADQSSADSPYALYAPAADSLTLTPFETDQGTGPHVLNGRMSVEARTIDMALSSQSLKAETAVRSVMTPDQPSPAAPAAGSRPAGGQTVRGAAPAQAPVAASTAPTASGGHVPSMFKQDKPMNGRSNRLAYDGSTSVATYSGSATVWQDDTTIKADTIVLDDKTGNLHATTGVVTQMLLNEAAPDAPGVKPAADAQKPQPTLTKADDLLYEDTSHRAVYTSNAHMSRPGGEDLTADRIEVYLAEQGGDIDRIEAEGSVVSRQELRRSYGRHMTYTARTDEYVMTGTPVKVYDDQPPDCKLSTGSEVTFHRLVNTATVKGTSLFPHTTVRVPVCGAGGAQ